MTIHGECLFNIPAQVRELKNIIERAMILSQSAVLHLEESLLRLRTQDKETLSSNRLKNLEREKIRQALEACEWRIEGPLGAAKHLGLDPSTLRSRWKKLAITKKI